MKNRITALSGNTAARLISQEFGDRFFFNKAGTTINLS